MAIKIILNDTEEELRDKITISEFLLSRNIRPELVIIKLNGKIVAQKDFQKRLLKDNDRVELIFFRQGDSAAKKCGTEIANSVLELIFNTPMVRLNRVVDQTDADIYAKLEFYSPGGSVKDRIALAMIEDAEKKGLLKPDSIIVEPTSGNTGIGIALVCAVKGYKCILTMPESMSVERRYILKSFNAELVLTPASEGMQGAVNKAKEIVSNNKKAYLLQQFENPANPEIHRQTTANEILKCMGSEFDAFVAGVGTGGTITGVGEILKKQYPKIKIVAVEPASSAVLSGQAPGLHKIQGIGAGFIPAILNNNIIDRIITVKDEDAYTLAQKLAKQEGILCGISSGANCFAALTIAKELGKGKKVVVIFPDTGERYFSLQQDFYPVNPVNPV